MTNIDADMRRREQGLPVTLNTINNVLTETGIEEAKDYARQLKAQGIEIGQIIASPFGRTMQTAFTIASVLGNLVPIEFDPRVQEIAWDVGGEFDRLENYIEGFDSKNLAYDEKPMIDHARGAITLESQLDVYERSIPALMEHAAAAKIANQDVLIVTHFFVVRSVMAYMDHGKPGPHMLDYSPRNLCLLSYDADEFINRGFDRWTAELAAKWQFEPYLDTTTDEQTVHRLAKTVGADQSGDR